MSHEQETGLAIGGRFSHPSSVLHLTEEGREWMLASEPGRVIGNRLRGAMGRLAGRSRL
jgi:hypothetical protein